MSEIDRSESSERSIAGAGPRGAAHEVRWPLVAKIGLVLAVLTVVAGIVAALVAAFVVDREDASVAPRALIVEGSLG